uniref:CNH domain-containing protein n=1 Tax=Macrostomum lignano TaxID=282301 RepID=A0A1I8JRA8_9PLAT
DCRPPHRSGRPPLLASPPPARSRENPSAPVSAEILGPTRTDDQQAADSSGDSLAAETADPGPPPTPPQRTSSHAGRNPPPARPPPPRLNGAGAAADKRPRPVSIAGPGADAPAADSAETPPAPRPATKMGAGMSQIFEDSPLKINAVAKWTNPAGCDLVFVGANEGLYYMSLDQLHDPTMVLLVRQRCLWLFVYRGILVSLSGRHPQLYRHDLAQLFPADAKSKLTHQLTHQLTHRTDPPHPASSRAGLPCGWPTTRRQRRSPAPKGCMRVSAAKHPETAERWLACALPQSVLLLQWDNARRTFLEFKSLPCPDLPQPLLTFELLIRSGFKLPFVCVGVLRGRSDACVRFRLLDLNKLDGQIELSPNDETALDEEVEVTSVTQLDLNHVLVCYRNMARVFHMDTGLVRSRTGNRLGTLSFEFTIESVQCLDDSLLCFYKHGFQAKSFLGGEVVQDVEDRAHVYRFVGFAGQNPVMERRPADDPMASCDLMLIIGHVSA